MPTFLTGNLWDEWGRASLVLFTSNSSVKRNGCLVMGRGSALEAQRYPPDFATTAGSWVRAGGLMDQIYGLFLLEVPYQRQELTFCQTLGAFQTKQHWRAPATLPVIAYSVGRLCALLEAMPYKFPSVAMPFPGIGAGGVATRNGPPGPGTVTVAGTDL